MTGVTCHLKYVLRITQMQPVNEQVNASIQNNLKSNFATCIKCHKFRNYESQLFRPMLFLSSQELNPVNARVIAELLKQAPAAF